MIRHATCSCGQLAVTCDGDPLRVGACHCLACQRRTGSAFGVAAFFRRELVVIEGESRSYARIADSGRALHHAFCPHCGSTVYWMREDLPDQLVIAVGAFADPGFPAPGKQVNLETRHPWVHLLG